MTLRTGQVAKQAGVNVETLRFYEREGILPAPPRLESGYREYPDGTVELIRFVKRAQELGFALREIKEMLSLREVPQRAAKNASRLVEMKIAEIDSKIRDLEAIRTVLGTLQCDCQQRDTTAACPIIASLNGTPAPAESRNLSK